MGSFYSVPQAFLLWEAHIFMCVSQCRMGQILSPDWLSLPSLTLQLLTHSHGKWDKKREMNLWWVDGWKISYSLRNRIGGNQVTITIIFSISCFSSEATGYSKLGDKLTIKISIFFSFLGSKRYVRDFYCFFFFKPSCSTLSNFHFS